jgi:RNA polymerase sigma factor (sigma-70 family)
MPAPENDRVLIRRCLDGDRAAWRDLILRYQRLLYAVPLRCGLTEEEAADVFQTVCVRLVEHLERLRDQERLASWLVTTANRESWRVKQRRDREAPWPSSGGDGETDEAGDAFEQLPDTARLPGEALQRLQEDQLVREALEELGERCGKLLRLLYFTDPAPAYVEIGRELGMPEGSIGPTRARCLQQLKKRLETRGF